MYDGKPGLRRNGKTLRTKEKSRLPRPVTDKPFLLCEHNEDPVARFIDMGKRYTIY